MLAGYFPQIIRDSRRTTVILRFDDAKLSCYNDAVRSHQIVIFIQVVTDTYPWLRMLNLIRQKAVVIYLTNLIIPVSLPIVKEVPA